MHVLIRLRQFRAAAGETEERRREMSGGRDNLSRSPRAADEAREPTTAGGAYSEPPASGRRGDAA